MSVTRASSLIPARLRFDLCDPRIRAERCDAADLGHEALPRGARRIDDGLVVLEQAVGEEALLEVEPQTLDRVQFRRARGQRLECDVGGGLEGPRPLPAR